MVDSVRSLVYDAVGNVLRDSTWMAYWDTSYVGTGTYDSTGNRIEAFKGCTYDTDADGNVESRTCGAETVDFWWSSDNRLDSLAVSGSKTRFWYDGFSRLVKRQVGGTTRYFWWDGDNLYAELASNGAKLVEYVYAGMDNPDAIATADSVVHFVHRDGLGNVIALVDDSGAESAQYGYTLWGSGWSTEDLPTGATNRARFKGALWMGDEDPELYYMRARWYEPRTGRFLSEDPTGLTGGINLYVYAGCDPVNARDPTGTEMVCRIWGYHLFEKDEVGEWHYLWTVIEGWSCSEGDEEEDHGSGGSKHLPGADHQQNPACRFNQTFLRRIDEEFALSVFENLERGGWYGAPWSDPVQMTATSRGMDWIDIPPHPGASGYWHTHHIGPELGYKQEPGKWDKYIAVEVKRSTTIVVAKHSLWVIDPRPIGPERDAVIVYVCTR